MLAIETSGSVGSVAVGRGSRVLEEERLSSDARHAGDLLPAMQRLVADQGWRPGDVDVCCVSVGPGSFTGLRIGVTAARHLALATGAKLVTVPSMEAIAEHARLAMSAGGDGGMELHIAVLLHARRDRVFGGVYRVAGERLETETEPRMVEAAELLRECPRPCVATGEGVKQYEGLVAEMGAVAAPVAIRHARAADVLQLGWERAQRGAFTPPQELVPLYIRRPEAEEVWERRAREAGQGAR